SGMISWCWICWRQFTARYLKTGLCDTVNCSSFCPQCGRSPGGWRLLPLCHSWPFHGSCTDGGFQQVDRLRQLHIDDAEVLRPAGDMAKLAVAVGDAAQGDQRQGEALAGAEHGVGLHI